MTHIDRDTLRLPAAQFPDLRGRESGRGNAGLRRGAETKRRRQLRLFPRQRDGIERRRIGAGQPPEISQNFTRRLHWGIPQFTQSSYAGLTGESILRSKDGGRCSLMKIP